MRTFSRRLFLPLLLVASVAACATRPRPDAEPEVVTYVRVTNQAYLDMNVYAVRGSQRVRLGMAGANQTVRFKIPDYLIFGTTALRFLVDPIGSRRVSQSFEILVSPGDEVTLTIPPRAG